MKFAILKERKNPPDRRVVFSPKKLAEAREQFPNAEFIVESSDIRVFPDAAYKSLGFKVTEDVSDCDVMIGVKEVPIKNLIPNKKYFYFSHTIKKQPYNRKLLKAMLEKNIEMYDHETIVSMNFWICDPSIFNYIETYFTNFLNVPENLEKSEIYLPFVAQEMMVNGLINIHVIDSKSDWFGVTYYEDKSEAVHTLKSLTEENQYPSPLWN